MRACVCVYACIYACLYMCLSMCAGTDVCRYACVYVCVHGRAQRRRQGLRPSDTPAVPTRRRELCAGGRRSPPVQSATRRAAGTRFSADRARSTPMRVRRSALRRSPRRGHTGSGRRTAAVLGGPCPFGGSGRDPEPVNPRELRKRASTHTQVRTDGGAGGRADRVRRTWRGLPTGRMRAGRPAGPLKCNRRASVTVCAHGSGVAVAMVCHLVRRSSSRTIEFGFVG